MILFGVVIVTLLTLGFSTLNQKFAVDSELEQIDSLAIELSQQVEFHLREKVAIARTLSAAPLIRDALLKSNARYGAVVNGDRQDKIERLNQQWKKTSDINAPFIQTRLTNPIAEYLKHQQHLFPGEYGEIFLTNRYGVMIASTSKLSTLAHGHKYWWLAAYDDGKGRIFLDDRGFDSSAQGYVIGVVVPIINNNQIIGLLKCNVHICGLLSELVEDFALHHLDEVKIVRTGGLVVSARGITPLSKRVEEVVVELLRTKESGGMLINGDGGELFTAIAPVTITMGSELIGFGGSEESVDHIKGNSGESWHVLISRNKEEALTAPHQTTATIVVVGIIFTLFTTVIALFLGKLAARPIVALAATAQNIGKGDLEARAIICSKDEIGLLGDSLNRMAKNIQDTMTSRDELLREVELRKKKEIALVATKEKAEVSESQLLGITNNLPVLICQIDRDLKYIFANDFANTLYCNMGLFQEVLVGKSVLEVIGQEHFDRIHPQMQKALSGEFVSFENKYHLLQDTSVFMQIEYIPHVVGGQVESFFVLGLNTTERRQAEEEKVKLEDRLQQAQKMESIGTLAGGIAHDFNNILAAILGYAEMARDECQPGSTVYRDVTEVLDAGNRAKNLVRQILAFSRQDDSERILLQPSSIIKEIIKMLRPSLPTTIEITHDIDGITGLIFVDPSHLNQILMNLCTNAFHAMEETGGKLDISLKQVTLSNDDLEHEPDISGGNFIQLSIADSGRGIETDIKDKIFDPYFTTKGIGKGTGMGLAMVHGIVKNYGGFISLYSELGVGTVFHVFLPVAEQETITEREINDQIPTGKERILFIDDEELLAQMGKTMLERLGYHVTVRNSSLDALETFQNQPDMFDLVITDQTMPGMTGSDLSRRMLQIRYDIPIILCTGYSTIISEEKAKAMGIREFAFKPLAKKDLAKLIRKVLDVA